MELIINIISCIATVGSLIIAVISLIKIDKTQKELYEFKNKYKHNKVTQEVKDNTGINVGFNGGVINEKKQ